MKKLRSRRNRATVDRLILHVGPPKTGSTAIQSALHLNREKLLLSGVFVPVNDVDLGQHGPVLRKFYKEADYAQHYPWDAFELDIDEILVEMTNADCRTLVLSSEHFSHAWSVTAVGRLLASIEPRQLQVVAGLRPALENTVSSFAQVLKVSAIVRQKHLDSLMEHFENTIAPRWENQVLNPFLEELRSRTDEASLDVLVFASGIDVIDLFEQATGLALPERDNLRLNERSSVCFTRVNWDLGNFIWRSFVTVPEQMQVIRHALDGFLNSPVPEHDCNCAETVSAEDAAIIDRAFLGYRDQLLASATRVWGDPTCLESDSSRIHTVPRQPDNASHDLVVKMLLNALAKTGVIFSDMAEGNEFWQETSRRHEEAAEYWRRQFEELAGR
jgi:hypothetical protein